MTAPGLDPLLPLMVRGRTLAMNNAMRAKLIAEAATQQRRDPQGFLLAVLQHLHWAEAEAIARDRCGREPDLITELAAEIGPRLLSSPQR